MQSHLEVDDLLDIYIGDSLLLTGRGIVTTSEFSPPTLGTEEAFQMKRLQDHKNNKSSGPNWTTSPPI